MGQQDRKPWDNRIKKTWKQQDGSNKAANRKQGFTRAHIRIVIFFLKSKMLCCGFFNDRVCQQKNQIICEHGGAVVNQ
jgi:hypothetical protein